jgi:hypothetical protein
MAKLESDFQKELMDEIRRLFPGCVIIKNDSGYIQGFPDWTIFYRDRWAVLEAKREKDAEHQPNQDDYVAQCDYMSFSRFVYPENKDEVLEELYQHFKN